MLNKFLSFLMLIGIIGGLVGSYYYFFVLNKGGLTLNGNIGEYRVDLFTDKLKTSFTSECKNSKCELIDLAPFNYEITIKKDGYKDYKTNVKVVSKKVVEMNFNLEKDLIIKPIESNNEVIENTGAINNKNKINEIKELNLLKKSYAFFNLKEMGYFYFVLNDDETITLKNKLNSKETNLYTFLKIDSNLLDVKKVFQTDDMILIGYGDKKYIYNLISGKITEFFFPQKLDYIKKNDFDYALVNDKGTFLLDEDSLKVEYFYLFKDFIYFDENTYFGVINSKETDKIKNYNLSGYSDNLIVKYNYKTKEIKVLQTTKIDIKKIVKLSSKVYFYDNEDNQYEVENIE